MRITIQRETETTLYGTVEASGQWVMRDRQSSDGWMVIDEPAWAGKPSTPVKAAAHPMADPYERNGTDVEMVTVRRVITRTVTDFEAEVLMRSGWERVP